MIKAVVFDFNGTLLADTNACWETDNRVLKTFGGSQVSLKTYRDTIVIPAIDFYSIHGCNKVELTKNSESLGSVFHEFYEKRAANLRSRKNARTALRWLQESKIESVILSNHTISGINFQLERLGLKEYVAAILANSALDSSMKGRNKQEKLEEYAKSSGLEKRGIIIVGDTCEEIEIGRSMGLTTVAITGGYYSAARLKKGGPDFMIGNLGELIKIVGKINS